MISSRSMKRVFARPRLMKLAMDEVRQIVCAPRSSFSASLLIDGSKGLSSIL